MIVLASLCVAAAVLLCWSANHRRRWAWLTRPDGAPRSPSRLPGLWPLVLPFAGLVIGLLFGVVGLVLGLCGGLIAGTTAWTVRTHLRRRSATRDEAEVVSACRLLVGLLRVGQIPGGALALTAAESPLLAEAAAAHQAGASVADVLRAEATRPGRAGLGELAVAWELAERTGASMTAALDSVVERQTAASAVAEVVASELAAPRATGRLLAVLPLAGLALGFTVGGDPLGFLLGSVVGRASLTIGVALACAGVLWTDWLARPGER